MSEPRRRDGWYRHPLFWLGSFVLAASLAGCAWMIVLAARYPDPPLDTGSGQILKMPLREAPPSASASAAAPPASASSR